MLFEIIFTYLFIALIALGHHMGRRQGIKEKEVEAWRADIRAKEKEADWRLAIPRRSCLGNP
jgi:hypothetical protein